MELALGQWSKVAMIVGTVMMEIPERVEGIPDVFYSQRVKYLVEQGFLEAEGNLDYLTKTFHDYYIYCIV